MLKPSHLREVGLVDLGLMSSALKASQHCIFSALSKGREIVDSGDEDFDDEESFEDAEEESGVQLGMVVPCEGREKTLLFRDIDWHDWDGGKAGGWPVWKQ